MLYSIESTVKKITNVSYKTNYDVWTEELSKSELQDIFDEINRQVEGEEVSAANIIAGTDWTDSVFQPIYEKACHDSFDASAKCLGLLICKALIDRKDCWSKGKYRGELKGANYFRIDNPEKN